MTMEATLADRLMQGAPADFESAAELSRAHQFALDTLLSVRPHLAPVVRTVLEALHILLTWLLPVLRAATNPSVRHFASRQKDRSSTDSTLVVDDRHYISNGYF